MKFTYQSYRNLIELLQKHGYKIASYHNWQQESRCVILRHDIDVCIEKALQFASLEQELGVAGTYFVLLTSEHYNSFARRNQEMLKKMSAMGHDIGLHFDETNYPEAIGNPEKIKEKILYEADMLAEMVEKPVDLVSMHRPSKAILEADLQIPGMINSYGNEYFKSFKYLSDSSHHWREPVWDIIESERYDKFHILTHAIWYQEEDKNIRDCIQSYLDNAKIDWYDTFCRNVLDLSEVIRREDIL